MNAYLIKTAAVTVCAFFLLSCSDDRDRSYHGAPEDVPSYTVRFRLNGGSLGAVENTADVLVRGIAPGTLFGDIGDKPAPFHHNVEYALVEWNSERDGNGIHYNDKIPVNSDITVYAVYGEDITGDFSRIVCDDPERVYTITSDADLGQITPICHDPSGRSAFMGKFYGNGYQVSYRQSSAVPDYAGLFSRLDGAYIANVTVNTLFSSTRGRIGSGVLAGSAEYTVIDNITVNGSISAAANRAALGGVVGILTSGSLIHGVLSKASPYVGGFDDLYIGGIAGSVDGGSRIENSYHPANNMTAGAGSGREIGGIAGYLDGGSIISCYTNDVISDTGSGSKAGGIVGYLANGTVEKSLALGIMVNAESAGRIAGRVGAGSISGSFASGSMLVNFATVPDSLKDGVGRELSGIRRTASFFVYDLGWDFLDIWTIPRHHEYPSLARAGVTDFIEISTAEDLRGMESNKNYLLVADIYFPETGTTWQTLPGFSGILDGNGKSIYNLRPNSDINPYSGSMFSSLSGTVQDITFVNPRAVRSTSGGVGVVADTLSGVIDRVVVKGGYADSLYGGGLASSVYAGGIIIDSSFEGTMHGIGAGGLAESSSGGYILFSSASGNVNGGSCAGGLVGSTLSNSIIIGSYSTADVYSSGIGRYNNDTCYAGGLAGCAGGGTRVIYSYAAGDVTARRAPVGWYSVNVIPGVGGLAGSVEDSMSATSSLVLGDSLAADVSDSSGVFTDTYLSGRIYGYKSASASVSLNNVYANDAMAFTYKGSAAPFNVTDPGEEALALTPPPEESYYRESLGWDFDMVWKMPKEDDPLGRVYPILRWQ
jgi:hypothetical protein